MNKTLQLNIDRLSYIIYLMNFGNEDEEIIEEAVSYFHMKLPLPTTLLEEQIKNIPKQILTFELQCALYSENKQIAFFHFCQLAAIATKIFTYEVIEKNQQISTTVQKIYRSVFLYYPEKNKKIHKQLHQMQAKYHLFSSTQPALEILLRILARTHYLNFQFFKQQHLFTMNKSTITSFQIPAKYDDEIQELLLNCFSKQKFQSDWKQSRESDMNAYFLRKVFFGCAQNNIEIDKIYRYQPSPMDFRSTATSEIYTFHKTFNRTPSTLLYSDDQSSKKPPERSPSLILSESENSKYGRQQQISKVVLSSPLIYINSKRKLLSFYDKNAMIRLSSLILNKSFDISLIKGKPHIMKMIQLLENKKKELTFQCEGLEDNLSNVQQRKSSQGCGYKLRKLCGNQYRVNGKNEKQSYWKVSKRVYNTIQTIKEELLSYSHSLNQIITEFESLRHRYQPIGKKVAQQFEQNNQKQVCMILIIYFYRRFIVQSQKQVPYTVTKRKIVCEVLSKMFDMKNLKLQFSNWSIVLRYLENSRKEISQISNLQVVQHSRILIQQLYAKLNNPEQIKNTNIFEGLEEFEGNLPMMKLVDVNKYKVRSKVVHLLISGFLSEQSDKTKEWGDMLETMRDCQSYALVWKSNTIKNFVFFCLKSAKDIITTKSALQQKFRDNPFIPAVQIAKITGRLLAQIVPELFPDQFVSICGYSLGSEVVKEFLNRMIQNNQQGMIYSIRIFGGVSHTPDFQEIIMKSKTSLSIYNCVSKHDGVLKHLLSRVNPECKPMGINPVSEFQGHYISNVDCNKLISGHLKYRSRLDVIGKVLEVWNG